jgi:ribosomal protein S17
MNICITPESIKLFGSFINRKLESRLTNDKSGEALLNELFNDALTVFSDNGLTSKRNKELVLQHMSIIPQIVLKYASDNPKLTNAKALPLFKDLALEVITAAEDENTNKFQKVIDRFGGFIGNNSDVVITEEDPLDRFEAVSLEIYKTSNQEAIYNPILNSYSENILDPKKELEFKVVRDIINNQNSTSLKFKLVTLGEIQNEENFDNTTGSINPNLPVLILIDTNNNIATFDSNGKLNKEGKFVAFTVKTDKNALQYQQAMLAKSLLESKTVDSIEKANDLAKTQIEKFIKSFEDSVAKVKSGTVVFMNIDLSRSSVGFISENRNIQTPLSELTNISTTAADNLTTLKQTHLTKQFYPILSIQNYNKIKRVYGKPLSALTEDELNLLHYILTSPELKDKKNIITNKNTNEYRKDLIHFFIDSSDLLDGRKWLDNPFEYFYVGKGKEKVMMLRFLNQKPIEASTLTLEKLKEWTNAKYGKPVYRTLNAEEPALRNSLEEANLGEFYTDAEGNLFEAAGLRRSFSNRRKASMNDLIYKVPIKVEDGVLTLGDPVSIGSHVIKHGYTTVVPTAENKLIGLGSYLAFKEGYETIVTNEESKFNDSDFDNIKFRSVPQRNNLIQSTKEQDKSVSQWWENSPLKNVVNVNMLNRISEFGPNYLASFIGNSINLYLGSSPTDLYHEAFHAYFDGILSADERKEIYDVLRKTPGYFTVTVEGQSKVVSYDDATNIELEEFLAEKFRDFAMSNGKKTTFSNNKIVAFFQKLLSLLKNVFGNMSFAEARAFNKTQGITDAMFTRLFKGEFTADMFNIENAETKWMSSEIKTTTGDIFSLEEIHDVMSSMKSVMSDFITQGLNVSQNPVDRKNATIILTRMSQYPESSQEYIDLANSLENISETSIRSGAGVFTLVSNPEMLNLMSKYILARFNQKLIEINAKINAVAAISDKSVRALSESTKLNFQKNLLEKVIKPENFGKLTDLNIIAKEKQNDGQQVEKTLLPLFLKSYSNLVLGKEVYQDVYETKAIEEDIYVPMWDRTGNDQLFDDTIEKGTKALLDSVFAYSEQGKGVVQLNGLGFKEVLPVKNAIAKVAKLLRNMPDAMDMASALKEAARTDKEIDQIFRRLGDISELSFGENMTSMEHRQWSDFWQSFNKADVSLREFILEKQDISNINGERTVKLTSKSGKSQSQSIQIERQWEANFKTSSLIGPFSTVTKEGTPVVDIEALLGDLANEYDLYYGLIEGGGEELFKSKFDRKKSKSNRYTTSEYVKGIADPYLLLNALGIDLVKDSDVRKILFEGDDSLGVSSAISTYIIKVLNNRMTKVVFDDGVPSLDPSAKFIKSLSDVFNGFMYFDENGKLETQQNIRGYLTQLRELQYAYSNEYTNFSGYGASGNLQSEKSFNSSLLNMVSALNNADNINDIINTKGLEYLNPYTNPQAASSRWLIDMFQLDPAIHSKTKRGNRDYSIKITTENLSGSKLISKEEYWIENTNEETGEVTDKKITLEYDNGVAAMETDETSQFISDFHLTLEGKQQIMRTEAKSTSLALYAPSVKKDSRRKNTDLLINLKETEQILEDGYKGEILFTEFKNHLAAELIRIQQITKLQAMIVSGEIKPDDIAIDVAQLNRGADWFVFDKIFDENFDKNLKKDLLAFNINTVISELENDKGKGSFSIDALSPDLKTRVENALIDYFKKETEKLNAELGGKLVIGDTLFELYDKQIESNPDLSEAENKEVVKEKMIKIFLMNNFIQNLNYNALFLGDVSVHDVKGEAFHKRIAGLISTGKIFRHDGVWMKYINSTQYNAYGFAKKHNKEKPSITLDYEYTGFLQTGIIKEAKSNSIYIDHYQKLLGVDTADYNGMKEADGQGWLSFDAYRILNDSIGEWSDAQEKMYQKMLAGTKLTQDDMIATFPVRKFQYYGNVSNPKSEKILKDLGITLGHSAFHKYSLMPLIPALIENTPLQIMHEKMMEQGIDYVTMESGSKLSSLSKVKVVETEEGKKIEADFDNFYDASDRGFNADIQFTPNVIHVKYLKSQIFLDEGYKGHITLPTQVRKIALIGILDGGVPTDFKYTGKKNKKDVWETLSKNDKLKQSKKWQWYQDYTNTLDEMQNVLRDRLLEDIALKEETVNGKKVYTGDSTKLANYLREKLKTKEVLPEEISYLIKPDGTLIEDLSFSLISDKLEEVLVTLVDKTLRRITVNGEALVQVSGTMFENFQVTGGISVSEEMLKSSNQAALLKNGSNGLKFYFLQDEFGNEVLDNDGKAIVKGMDVKISLQGDFKKLLYTENVKGEKIAVYTEDENGKKILDYTESLKRLNAAIKTTYWQNKYGELIKLPGVRIPTQGPNSLVAATVAEFLPEFAGPTIILPTEIVSQSGSDFDIDKLFMMFINIRSYNGSVEAVKYSPSTRTYEEIKESIQKEEPKLEKANVQLQNNWKEYTDYLVEKQGLNEYVGEFYREISDLQVDIDFLYKEKKAVYENKDYDYELQQKMHDDLQKQIDEKVNQKLTLLSFAQSETNTFFDTVIKNKADRMAVVKENYLEFMSKIEKSQEAVDKIKVNISNFQRERDGKGVKGLENRFFDLLNKRVLMNDNLKHLITPNTTKDTEEPSRNAGKLIKKNYDKLQKNGKISNTSIFEYRFNLLKHQENSVGKDSLGIAAVTSTFYALFTTFGATLQETSNKDQAEFIKALELLQDFKKANTPQYAAALKTVDTFNNKKLNFVTDAGTPGFNLNVEKNAITLGAMKNVDGLEISDILSQLINGFVDVAKDAWIFDAQGTKETAPVLLFMVMSGMNVSTAINMVNNPLVLEFNQVLEEYKGVFAALSENYEKGKTDTSGKAAEILSKKYSNLFSDPTNLSKASSLGSYNRIANTAKSFTNDDIKNRLGQEPNYRDMEILSHFLQIKQMAQALTDFTMVSKFDTQKISNISEAQARIESIEDFKLIPIGEKIVPNEWFDKLKDTPVGKFNNDEFIVDLFSKYFKLRNNKALILRSLDLKRPKGVDKRKLLADFKNDFLWFLYQNAVYNDNVYTTSTTKFIEGDVEKIDIVGKSYTLIEDSSIEVGMDINEETNEVRYHPEVYFKEASMVEFTPFRKFFNVSLPKEWVKFRLEYNNLSKASENLTQDQFKEKFKLFDQPKRTFMKQGFAQGKLIILGRAALYNAGNADSMFDISTGASSIVQNLKSFYPELEKYAFFRDVKYDYNESAKKNNIYFPQVKDSQMASIYKENIKELKNSPHADVKNFMHRLNHLAIMQSGVNRSSKYSMLPIIDQSYFEQSITNQIGLPYIYQVLDELQKSFDQRENRKAIDAQIIDQFKNLYQGKIAGAGMRMKVRGTNYLVNKLKFSKDITLKESKVRASNITKIPLGKALTTEQKELRLEYFYNDDSLTPLAFAESIQNMQWVIRDQKFIAPENKSQKELDVALMILGIDNSGKLPSLRYKTKNVKEGVLSIAQSNVFKEKFAIIDEAMANSSNKAIGKSTDPFNKQYESSSAAYAEALESFYPGTLAKAKSTKTSFASTDKVWVFGSTITKRAFQGKSKEEFIKNVEKTFDSYHKPLIDKAIAAGVSSFFVGTASGIDDMAVKHLEGLGFKKVIRYSELGTYNEMISIKEFESATDPLYDPKLLDTKTEVSSVFNELLDSFYGDVNREAPEWFKKLSQSELINNGKDLIKNELRLLIAKLDSDYKQNNYVGFRVKLINELKFSSGRITVGKTLFDSLVEQTLMEYRQAVLASSAKLNVGKTIIQKPAESNEQYNDAVLDYLLHAELNILKVGDEIELTYKNTDSEGIAIITEIQKINNNLFKVKLSSNKDKEYTFLVDNFGKGEKIEIEQLNLTVFEREVGEFEMAKNNLDALEPIEEIAKQGYLSTPIISPIKEKYKIARANDSQAGKIKSLSKAGRDAIKTVEGYRITFKEHPNAIFYLSPVYYSGTEDPTLQTGWQIENVNSGLRATNADTISETFKTFVKKFKQLQNVNMASEYVVDIITVTGMDINKLTPDENAEVKYTYLTLPFSKAEKETILTNFTAKFFKGKSTREAQKYIEEALEKADEQGQKEIIEKLKSCYK